MTNYSKELARLRESAGFLGYEFLNWLFLLLDRENARESVARISKTALLKEDIELALGNRLVSCLLNHKEQKTSIASPLLEESHEVFASLKSGHVIESLAVVIRFSEISLSFMIHATDSAFTQIKIKNNYDHDALAGDQDSLSEHDKTREEIFLRMSALLDLEKVVDAFYQEFIKLRLSASDYHRELAEMCSQINQRLTGYLSNKPQEFYARDASSKETGA